MLQEFLDLLSFAYYYPYNSEFPFPSKVSNKYVETSLKLMVIKFLDYDSICQGESDSDLPCEQNPFDPPRKTDFLGGSKGLCSQGNLDFGRRNFCQRVLAPRSLEAYSCKFFLLRKSVEQIRKTPSKFSNITRAEVFWFSAPFCIELTITSTCSIYTIN